MSFFIVFQSIKLAIALILQNYSVVYPIIGMVGSSAVTKLFNIKKEYHQPALIMFINISYTIYILFFDPHSYVPTMYFRGAHQMMINVINIIGSEFIDSTLSLIVLYFLRLLHLIQNSESVEFTSILLAIGSNLSLLLIVYLYHKAIRSQFLLTQVDQRWKKVQSRFQMIQNLYQQIVKLKNFNTKMSHQHFHKQFIK
ncbi:unnamed protein product (macronuclear) [Paramecium tetraurelia]|uniref:Transmembrane protein n=1 Tax=Paramecium tetraurelia TaxID=5888 RepID=A0EAG9_PARTE|nr:uncharacterized protein GSPATT00025018001 [Paramecium tetraurelia]CAK92286.1 unnamed protein product [Paramecium tetraurelia]|eukprot:XP_001459683.1 hypothetical protein (macronuclear) [Paramecium tetraurelia strain d4-2]